MTDCGVELRSNMVLSQDLSRSSEGLNMFLRKEAVLSFILYQLSLNALLHTERIIEISVLFELVEMEYVRICT